MPRSSPTPALFLALAFTGLAGPLWAQEAPARPPIAAPGALVQGQTQDAIGPQDIARMEQAIRQSGCFIQASNREAVLQRFGGGLDKARSVLDAMEAQGTVIINAERGTADLVGCAPVPMAGDEAVALQ